MSKRKKHLKTTSSAFVTDYRKDRQAELKKKPRNQDYYFVNRPMTDNLTRSEEIEFWDKGKK